MATRTAAATTAAKPIYGLPFVITAASAGTIIEWYDFYLYATLADATVVESIRTASAAGREE